MSLQNHTQNLIQRHKTVVKYESYLIVFKGHICKYVDRKGSAAMLTPFTVSRCCTSGESEDDTGKKACKGIPLALKPRYDITRSPKQGYQWPQKKDLCPPNFFSKIILFKATDMPKKSHCLFARHCDQN